MSHEIEDILASTNFSPGKLLKKLLCFLFPVISPLIFSSCTSIEITRDNYSGTAFRDQLSIGVDGPEMVWIPSGHFRMGNLSNDVFDDDEVPVHNVAISNAFALAKYETTIAEFRLFIEATNYKTWAESHGGCRAFKVIWREQEGATWVDPYYQQQENHPVVCVSWGDAIAYVSWLSKQSSKEYRLPTEAEWEFAARGGTETSFWWGDEGDCAKARCRFFSPYAEEIRTVDVGSYAANAFGLYDVSGNVWEWTASEYVKIYDGSEQAVSKQAIDKGLRVIRGGAWYNYIVDMRSSNRGVILPYEAWSTVGFRVARTK